MAKITIIEHNANDKDNVRAYFLKGEKGETGDTGNGILSIEKTGETGNIDTYTITFTNGSTTTFQVANGDGATIIVDDLNHTDTDKALSANQGKVLKGLIDKTKNCITAKLSANSTIVSSSIFDINFDTSVSSGTGLTLNNRGSIVIGSKVDKVKVSAHINSETTSSSAGNYRFICIYHYSATLESGYIAKQYIYDVADRMITNFTPILIDVAEGDTIYISYSNGENDEILGGALGDTYLTVEEV